MIRREKIKYGKKDSIKIPEYSVVLIAGWKQRHFLFERVLERMWGIWKRFALGGKPSLIIKKDRWVWGGLSPES